jgi:hypothetical protein
MPSGQAQIAGAKFVLSAVQRPLRETFDQEFHLVSGEHQGVARTGDCAAGTQPGLPVMAIQCHRTRRADPQFLERLQMLPGQSRETLAESVGQMRPESPLYLMRHLSPLPPHAGLSGQ